MSGFVWTGHLWNNIDKLVRKHTPPLSVIWWTMIVDLLYGQLLIVTGIMYRIKHTNIDDRTASREESNDA